jgi:hypothetical protein
MHHHQQNNNKTSGCLKEATCTLKDHKVQTATVATRIARRVMLCPSTSPIINRFEHFQRTARSSHTAAIVHKIFVGSLFPSLHHVICRS